MSVRQLSIDEWRDALPDRGFEVFHLPEALQVLESHSNHDLYLYGTFNGERPVGLIPLFVREGPLGSKAVFSPPLGCNVPYLGPLLMTASPKQSKVEKRNQEFVEAVLDEMDVNQRTLWHMSCGPTYDDPRPFHWNKMTTETHFTFQLDCSGDATEEVLKSFSKSRRREINDARDADVIVEQGDMADAKRILEAVSERFAQQGKSFGPDWDYVSDVLEALEDRHRIYVARSPDGEALSGVIVLYSNDKAYFWIGGSRSNYDGVTVNSILHWNVIQDLVEDPDLASIDRYDLVGASEQRLSRYKSKFSPELKPYYIVKSDTVPMTVASEGFNQVNAVMQYLRSP